MANKGNTGGGVTGVLRQFFISLGLSTNTAEFLNAFELTKILEGGIKAVAIAAGHAFGGMLNMVTGIAELGEHLYETSLATGISTQDLQKLGYAAGVTGVQFERLKFALTMLQMHLDELALGKTSKGAKMLERMGFTAEDAKKAPIDILNKYTEAFGKLDTTARKVDVSRSVMGRGGTELIAFFSQGKAGIEGLEQEFVDFGGVLDDVAVKMAITTSRDMRRLHGAFEGISNIVGAKVLPVLDKFLTMFLAFLKENKNSIIYGLTEAFKVMGAVLTGLWHTVETAFYFFRALYRILDAFVHGPLYILIPALGALTIAFGGLALPAIGAALPIIALVAGITALALVVEDLVVGSKGGVSVIYQLKDAFLDWWDAWTESVGAEEPVWLTYLKTFLGLLTGDTKAWNTAIESWKIALEGFFVWIGEQMAAIWNFTLGRLPGMHIDDADIKLARARQMTPSEIVQAGGVPFQRQWTTQPSPVVTQLPVVTPLTVTVTVNAAPGDVTSDLVKLAKSEVVGGVEAILRRTYNAVKGSR